jgi:hypothetical protein
MRAGTSFTAAAVLLLALLNVPAAESTGAAAQRPASLKYLWAKRSAPARRPQGRAGLPLWPWPFA